MTRELDHLIRLLRLAELRRDHVAVAVIQSRVGRLTPRIPVLKPIREPAA